MIDLLVLFLVAIVNPTWALALLIMVLLSKAVMTW